MACDTSSVSGTRASAKERVARLERLTAMLVTMVVTSDLLLGVFARARCRVRQQHQADPSASKILDRIRRDRDARDVELLARDTARERFDRRVQVAAIASYQHRRTGQ